MSLFFSFITHRPVAPMARWRPVASLLLATLLPLASRAQTLFSSQTLAPGTYTFSLAAGQGARLDGWGGGTAPAPGGGGGGIGAAADGGGRLTITLATPITPFPNACLAGAGALPVHPGRRPTCPAARLGWRRQWRRQWRKI